MTFQNPGLLWLLPLALIPIIIHLLNRLRYKRVQWAAMDFLISSRMETIKRSRLKNLLLLAARFLGLLLLVLAIARPVATGGMLASVFVGGTGRRMVLLDNSASMEFVRVGRSNLDRAVDCLEIILDASARSERLAFAALVQPGGETVYVSGEEATPEAIEELVEQTHASFDVRSALRAAARELTLTGGGAAEMILITDLQRSNWHAEDSSVWTGVRDELAALGEGFSVRVVDVGAKDWRNTAVADVSLSESVLVPGRRVTVRAGLARSGAGPASSVVSLYVDGERRTVTEVEWPEGTAAAPCAFEVEIGAAPAVARVELGEDKLTADNRRYLVMDPCREIPVLCMDGRPAGAAAGGASAFIAWALDPEPDSDRVPNPFKPVVRSGAEAAASALGDFSAVVLASVAAPAPDLLAEARTYVEKGGMLLVFLGEGADPAAYRKGVELGVLPAALKKIEGTETKDGIPIASVDYAAPALEKFGSPDNPHLQDVRVWRWWKLEVKRDEGTKVLLGLENGAPWLVERRLGSGLVFVCASPCDGAWSGMPVSPAFLPLMHRLVLTFVSGSIPESFRTAGEPIGPSRRPAGMTGFRVTGPDGKASLYKTGADETLCRDTLTAGIYTVRTVPEGPREERYAVNVPFAETQGERISEEEIRGLLKDIPVSVVRADDRERGLAGSSEGWPLAALAVLLLLLAEVVIARTID
jgi:hypothetical protein